MKQKIISFHQDEYQDWVTDLACGHSQHVRHDPPWQNRPWVSSEQGRKKAIGMALKCMLCDSDCTTK